MRNGYVMWSSLLGIMFIQERIDYMLFRESYYTQIMLTNNLVEVKVDRYEASYSFNSSC